MQNGLNASAADLGHLLEALPQGVILADQEGRIRQVNDQACLLLGLSREALQSTGLTNPAWQEAHPGSPALLAETFPSLAVLRETLPRRPLELLCPGRDGQARWLTISTHALPEGSLLVSFEDITQRKNSEQRCLENHGLLQTLINTTTDAIYVKDSQGRYLFFNSAAEQVVGKKAEDVLGLDDHAIFPPLEAELIMAGDRKVLAAQTTTTYEETVTDAQGRSSTFLSTKGPIFDGSGRLLGLFGIARDITARKRAEEALQASAKKYALVFQNTPALITLSEIGTGKYLEVNEAFLRASGFSKEEVIGQTSLELGWVTAKDREDMKRQLLEQGRIADLPLDLQAKDGHTVTCLYTGELVTLGDRQCLLTTAIDITARRQAELALQESESRFRDALDYQPIPIGIAQGDSITHYNQKFIETFGYTVEDTPTMSDWIAQAYPDPDYRQASMERWNRDIALALEQQTASAPGEYVITCKDGTKKTVIISGRQVGSQFVASFLDITGLKQAEQALRDSESRLRAIWDAEPECIKLVSPEGLLLDMNQAGMDMLEIEDRSQIIGRPVVGMVAPEHRERFLEIAWRTFEEGSGTGEFELISRKGSRRWMETHAVPLRDEASQTTLLLAVTRDISARKQAEQEQTRLQAQLLQVQKMESLGNLAGGIAHDMNNVLGAILGLASAHLDSHPPNDPVHRAFDTICRAAERGGKMVKSLLSFAHQQPVDVRDLDLNEILREEAALLERTTLAKVHLKLELAPDLARIRGDAGALNHALMNLCINAVDALPDGGTLSLRTRNLDSDWIEVQVQDTGTGMSREVQEKALDPFFTTKPQGKGTGLGLSMVYSTVKAHHGQMEIQSEPGQGTLVRLRFQAITMPSAPTAHETAPEDQTKPPALEVLLVDDDELVRSSIEAMLEALGHRVTSACSGEEALAKLESGFQPDAVVLDMNMPGLGGAGTLPRLRSLQPQLPVLLATGRADQTALGLVADYPRVTLLAKPFSMNELRRHLEHVQ